MPKNKHRQAEREAAGDENDEHHADGEAATDGDDVEGRPLQRWRVQKKKCKETTKRQNMTSVSTAVQKSTVSCRRTGSLSVS